MIRSTLAAALFACAVTGAARAETADPAGERVGTEYMVFEVEAEETAKARFLRGLALLHNFEYARAGEAFRAAQAADPGFAMAYWGEAMTHNHPLWEEQDRDAARAILARLAPSAEARAAKARSPREKAWLAAIETLYAEEGTKDQRDLAYLARMRAMLANYPDDIDVRAFTGLAVLGSSHGGRQVPIYMEAAGILEPGFMTHPQHPGILHYLIHSYDDPVHAPLGERMAERYATVAPDAGHAQHMVSHIFHALADWEASEEANINADAVVDRQRIAAGRAPTDCGHYNEWLVYARLQQGKDASDRVAACRAVAESGEPAYGPVRSYSVMAAWQAVDTGKWPEPLDEDRRAFLLPRLLLTHVEALRRREDPSAVAAALAEMRGDAEAVPDLLARMAPDDRTTMPWIERAIAQVEAVRLLASGDTQGGLAALRAAAEAESALPTVFGPPAMPKPSWELLGEELLALGRREEAAEAFRNSLRFAPGRRLSLKGLEAATGT
ncbi:hypothetical protein [Erythrobacter sp. HL-111]|uniref:hypothetical protein n=1 Tax=Erythrobacter sp. HL-111 TaxID=1798193 RepID=UPI0006DA95B5|nr:hypothetical protein [Erythrobacter sp. HL-111]KPP93439.1 MAG: Tetratricopeptide repeat [Erythrobacteraceae bacterium HL-111]SDR69391.1 hypothetical protein SAMN04515621_0096 [Erythrobacter sp. HL-111]